MTNEPFRLIFKRSQSNEKRPSFSLLVHADMSPEFEQAAKLYGHWNELIYADPKLEEARELRNIKADQNYEKAKRRAKAVENMNGDVAFFLLPFYLTYKLFKWAFVLPFQIAWWIYKARKSQKEQIMRFSELLGGKTITTKSIVEIAEAEEMIVATTDAIKTEILASMNYGGEAFEVKDEAA